jgi:zinc protease
MLTEILDGGSSSRLSRKLVRGTEVASAINVGYDAFDLRPGLLELEANAAQGRDIAQVEQAIRQEIEALKTEPVTAAELERVRNRVIAAKVFERDSVYYQAMQIGMLEATGRDWRLADQYVDKISAITAEQVQAVAKKYLTDDRLTVAVLDPQPMPDTPRRRASAGGYHGIR